MILYDHVNPVKAVKPRKAEEIMKKGKRKKRVWNLKSYITQALRKIFFYSPLRSEAMRNARYGNGKYFRCAISKKLLPAKKVTVDHILPVVEPGKGFQGWDVFISRLFCDSSNLQVISKEEHKKKTARERKERNTLKNV